MESNCDQANTEQHVEIDTVDVSTEIRCAEVSVAGVEDFPGLASLRLNASDWTRLRRQGFVASEMRANTTVFKLRFRRAGGRQVVRSIGASAERAAVVVAELARLQASRNSDRELAMIENLVREQCRRAKQSIEPFVLANNWKFHGRTVRRPRLRKNIDTNQETFYECK
jgi:hypothetical protein